MRQKVILIAQTFTDLTQLEQQAINTLRHYGGELEIGSLEMKTIPRYVLTGLIEKGCVVIERSEEADKLEQQFKSIPIPKLSDLTDDEYNRLFEEGQSIFQLGDPITVRLPRKG